MKEYIFTDILELATTDKLYFPRNLLSDKNFRRMKDELYGTFREQKQIPPGEMLSDEQLQEFLAQTHQLLLNMAYPKMSLEVIPLPDKTFKVIIEDPI